MNVEYHNYIIFNYSGARMSQQPSGRASACFCTTFSVHCN